MLLHFLCSVVGVLPWKSVRNVHILILFVFPAVRDRVPIICVEQTLPSSDQQAGSCLNNKCLNGGRCLAESGGGCDCSGTGFTGPLCAVPASCAENLCQNGGQCISNVSGTCFVMDAIGSKEGQCPAGRIHKGFENTTYEKESCFLYTGNKCLFYFNRKICIFDQIYALWNILDCFFLPFQIFKLKITVHTFLLS